MKETKIKISNRSILLEYGNTVEASLDRVKSQNKPEAKELLKTMMML